MFLTATWAHQKGRRWTLLDHDSAPRGEFNRTSFFMRSANAVIQGQPFELVSRGIFTKTFQVTDGAGNTVLHARLGGAFSWKGTMTARDGSSHPVTRKIALPLRFTVGDPEHPLIVMRVHHRRADLTFHPDLPSRSPEVLPFMLLLLMVHERSTASSA